MNDQDFSATLRVAHEAVERGLVPSICLALGLKDQVLAKACYGKTSLLPDAAEVNESTLYDMASMTKLMGPTMAALRYIARGKLDLTDTLPMFFGGDVPDDKKEITIYHLMTHTSGYAPSVRMDRLFRDADRVLPYLLALPLEGRPGKQVAYSCLGYILLGKILEKLSGMPLDELCEQEVFGPLGMKNTCYHPLNRHWDPSNTAYTERSSFADEWLVGKVHDENAYLLEGVSGNAGIFSNLNDCIRFARMISCMGRLENMVYLSSCVLREAMRDQTGWSDNHKGLGFDLTGGWNSICGPFFSRQAAGHTGFTGTAFYTDPDRGAWVVLLSNRVHPTRENANMPRIRRTVFNSFASELSIYMNKQGDYAL